MDTAALQELIRDFTRQRDWEQFHTPKNLAMALAGEVGELVAEFQWLTPEESNNLDDEHRVRVSQEIADVAIYILRLCDTLGIDLEVAIGAKLALNAERYPVEKARGSPAKYSEL